MERFWRPHYRGVIHIRQDLAWLFGLTLLLVGVGLGLRDPWPADEPRFALIAQDMVRTGNWLVPMIGGDLYEDKPPVFFWLIAIFLKLTGSLRIAFLLPSLLATMGTVVLVYDLGRRLWNRETGLAAGIVLLLTVQFVWQGRQAQIDATLCFWTTLGLYGLLRHLLLWPAWGWYVTGWAAAGIGVITKGVGFLPLLVLGPYVLAHLARRPWHPHPILQGGWRWALGPVAFVAVVGVWLVPILLASLTDPALAVYRNEILFQQTFDRYVDAWHHHKPFWYFFVEVIPWLWLPLTALLPWLVPRWKDALASRDLRVLLLLVWAAMVVLFFSFSTGKRGVYVLPALPAVALAAAPWLIELTARRGPQRVLFGLACVIPAVLASAALYLLYIDPELRAHLLAEEGIDAIGPLSIMAGAGAMVCMVCRLRRSPLAFGGVVAVSLVLVGLLVNPIMNADRSGVRFAELLEQRTAAIPELGLVAYKEQYLLQLDRPTFNFGHSRWRQWEQEATDAAAWLAVRPGRGLIIDQNVREYCFENAAAIALDEENRKKWFLVTGGADPRCVAAGDPSVAKLYFPPAVD